MAILSRPMRFFFFSRFNILYFSRAVCVCVCVSKTECCCFSSSIYVTVGVCNGSYLLITHFVIIVYLGIIVVRL